MSAALTRTALAVPALAALLLLACIPAAAATSTPPWVFVSSPDWFNEDVADLSGTTAGVPQAPGWPLGTSGGVNGISPQMAQVYELLVAEMASHGPQAFLVAGDLVNGRWLAPPALDMFDPQGRNYGVAIDVAGAIYYGWHRQLFARHGIPLVLAALGDHELGDDPWPAGSADAQYFGAMRQAFVRRMVDTLGLPADYRGVPSRAPAGFASYMRRLNNVLFVSVDVFRQASTTQVLHPLSQTVTFEVSGSHLAWLADVLSAADADPTIDHVIVQGHVPVIDPVRMQTTSGLLLVGRQDSAFWQLLRQHDRRRGGKLRLYLAGEVHAATTVLDANSDIVQLVHGAPPRMEAQLLEGTRPGQYAVFTVRPDRIDVELHRFDLESDGTSRYWQLNDRIVAGRQVGDGPSATTGSRHSGSLALQVGATATAVTGTGWLAPIRSGGLVVHFGFDLRTPAGEWSNTGGFGDLYYAGIPGGRVDPSGGRIGGGVSLDGLTAYVESGRGSIAEGEPRSAAAWLKSSAAGVRTVLSYGNKRSGINGWFDFIVRGGIPRIEIGLNAACVAQGAPPVNDGQWHHVAVTLTRAHGNRCVDARFYVDGQPYAASGGEAALYTTPWANLRIGVDHRGDSGFFQGQLDDAALWHGALSSARVRALVRVATEPGLGYDAAQMDELFRLADAGDGMTLVGGREWRPAVGLAGAGGELIRAGDQYSIVLDAAGSGVTTAPAAPPPPPGTIYEAEDARLGGAVVAKSGVGGYTGSGYADFVGEGFIEWTVRADAAGVHDLVFRYALGRGDRALSVRVDGALVTPALTFVRTGVNGDWSVWSELGIPVALAAGTHVVRVASTGMNGPNVDHLELVPTAPAPLPPGSVYESEQAVLDGSLVVSTRFPGFTGSGYVDFIDEGAIEWTVDVPAGGTQHLVFRYALGRGDRALAISVDGKLVNPGLNFARTGVNGEWTNWVELAAGAPLAAGTHVVRAASTGMNGPNLDHLRVD